MSFEIITLPVVTKNKDAVLCRLACAASGASANQSINAFTCRLRPKRL